jgi:outer membrane lipoprotein SlyB
MRTIHLVAPALLPAMLLSGCVTTTVASRTWGPAGDPNAVWVRYGQVESIRETVVRQQGDPAAGAAAGAIVGGILGSVIGGPHHHGGGAGAFFGAIGGAMVGAAASQGGPDMITYEVWVRFDDGGYETFVYAPPVPFRIGDRVSLTPQGLARQ